MQVMEVLNMEGQKITIRVAPKLVEPLQRAIKKADRRDHLLRCSPPGTAECSRCMTTGRVRHRRNG
jgi:hypothetical protein